MRAHNIDGQGGWTHPSGGERNCGKFLSRHFSRAWSCLASPDWPQLYFLGVSRISGHTRGDSMFGPGKYCPKLDHKLILKFRNNYNRIPMTVKTAHGRKMDGADEYERKTTLLIRFNSGQFAIQSFSYDVMLCLPARGISPPQNPPACQHVI